MRKAQLITVFALILGLLTFAGIATAETTSDTDWNAHGGFVDHTFTAGDDATFRMSTGGSHFWGEFNATDKDNNPYTYGVDSVYGDIDARVENGGGITFEINRTDAKTSGPAGQRSYSSVESDNGYAGMIYRGNTNYARLRNSQYGFRNDNQFFASGSNYSMYHSLRDGDGDGAYVDVVGSSGNARITTMSDESWGGSFKFGTGSGTYTNAGVDAVGPGSTIISGFASNYLEGAGWTMPSGGTHTSTWNYNDSVDIDASDFWMKGN